MVEAFISGSLALIADMGHVVIDTFLGVIPLLITLLTRNHRQVLRIGGAITSAFLLVVGLHIFIEVAEQAHENTHAVNGWYLFVFTALAGSVNFFQHKLLSRVSRGSRHPSHKSFHLHILVDLAKNIGPPCLGLLIMFEAIPHEAYVWAARFIGAVILLRAVLLLRESLS